MVSEIAAWYPLGMVACFFLVLIQWGLVYLAKDRLKGKHPEILSPPKDNLSFEERVAFANRSKNFLSNWKLLKNIDDLPLTLYAVFVLVLRVTTTVGAAIWIFLYLFNIYSHVNAA